MKFAIIGTILTVAIFSPAPFANRAHSADIYPANCGTTANHVVMVRGVIGYWPNADHLADCIMEQGMSLSIHSPLAAMRNADAIANFVNTHESCPRLNIVAYSLGCDAAIQLCHSLNEYGVTVDRLILIETTFCKAPIPENVRYCVNLYEERGFRDHFPAFRGVPQRASCPSTTLVNKELSTTDLPERRVTHFNIASKEATHEFVLKQLETCIR
ncbi:hypothetical protein [Rubinisphaera sp. JC750]|uniref:hypothetical protein n=1 Tax=Rubinisphaera sp. JC750 TaxID=2898658 RepID=UPI001F2AF946|nr:hypothetical protein [Rubinisphaera sp. JC750]